MIDPLEVLRPQIRYLIRVWRASEELIDAYRRAGQLIGDVWRNNSVVRAQKRLRVALGRPLDAGDLEDRVDESSLLPDVDSNEALSEQYGNVVRFPERPALCSYQPSPAFESAEERNQA